VDNLLYSNPLRLAFMEAAYILIESFQKSSTDPTNYPSLPEYAEQYALQHIFAYVTGGKML